MSNNTNNATGKSTQYAIDTVNFTADDTPLADATANSLLGTNHPNEPMAYIALGLFTFTALYHLFQFFKNRAWFLYFLGFGIFSTILDLK